VTRRPPRPPDEADRLRSLRALRILDTPHEPAFERIADLAARACDAPIAAVSLVDDEREWFKSCRGTDAREGARDESFCAHAVVGTTPMVVEDALADDRFRDIPQVREGGVRSYAGAPIHLSDGHVIGTVCVKDHQARPFTPAQVATLVDLAELARVTLESRLDRDAEHRLATIVASADDAIICTSLDGYITDWNAGAERLLGFTPRDCLGVHVRALIPDDRSDEAEWIINSVRTGCAIRNLNTVRRHASGELVELELSVSPVRDEHGNVIACAGIARGLAEQRLAEKRLIRSEELLQRTGRIARVGGWELDVPTGELRWTDEVYRIHELDPSVKPSVDRAIEFYEPEARPLIRAAVERCMQDGTPWDLELPFVTAKGRRVWVRAIGEPELRDGRIVRLFGAFQDITERKLAELELGRTQQRLDLAISAAHQGLWDLNPQTGEAYFNDQWFTMLGYTPGELPTTFATWEQLVHDDDFGPAMDALDDYFSGRTDRFTCEFRLLGKDGQYRWILSIGEIVQRASDGSPARMIGVHFDIDAQKRVQADLDRAREAAETASTAKSLFLANMSHEVRTPLSVILGFADLLCSEQADPEDARAWAETIKRNGEHLLQILNDVLDISKIEAGKVELEAAAFDPGALIDEVTGLFRVRAEERGLELRVRHDPNLPASVTADPLRFRQVLLNLIDNAVKFTRHGHIEIGAALLSGRLVVSVTDTGIGIPHEYQDRLFEPFTQADTSTTRRFGGTGLGLTISARLARMMGGDIELESAEGQGSTFRFSIPVRLAGTSDRPRTEITRDTDLTGVRVLLVEDGVDNQRLLVHHLSRAGADVQVAANGLEAIAALERLLAEQRLPDVVLMDMQMPELDAYDATRVIRERAWRLPVIALTAHAMAGDRERCIEAGCDEFLTKPVDVPRLLSVCASFARASRQSAA